MRKTKVIVTMLILSLLLSNISMVFAEGGGVVASESELVPQDLDYTENPVDVPNPDRGYYRPNDGRVVPVTGGTGSALSGSTGWNGTVAGATVQTRIVQAYFDLRNYSSNAIITRPSAQRYNASYRAPDGQVGPGLAYQRHFDYWLDNVYSTWARGESQVITADGLAYIRAAMQSCRDGGTSIIMRFNYDGGGYSWVDVDHPVDGYIDQSCSDIEPDKDMMLAQIAQLKPIFQEYEDVIMGVDGGFFGPWGEMHSTTYGTSTEAYAWLLNALLDAVPESCSIMVHAGAYLSWHNAKHGTNFKMNTIDQIPVPAKDTPESRFGFFNDSYGYGEDEGDDYPNDWGSLSEGAGWPGDPLGPEEAFDRGKVMTWIRGQNNFYGGEAQGDRTLWNTYPFVAWEASYAQTVYLNSSYEASTLNRWNVPYTEALMGTTMQNKYADPYGVDTAFYDPVYAGKTGGEYWRDRLGYRLVLRDANASAAVPDNGALEFEGKIQNVGFGNVVNKKAVRVVLKGTDGTTYTALTDLDARDWRPALDSRATNTDAHHDLSFSVNIEDFDAAPPIGEYDIFLKLNDPKEQDLTKRSIQFANNGGIWDATLAANKIGSTEIIENVPLESISLSEEALTLEREKTETLNVIYNPNDTTDRKSVAWSSNDESVATVDGNGKVTALKVGNATITATLISDPTKKAECTITVEANLKDMLAEMKEAAEEAKKAVKAAEAEVAKTKAEADKAKADAGMAKAEVDKAIAAADKAIVAANQAKAEAEKAQKAQAEIAAALKKAESGQGTSANKKDTDAAALKKRKVEIKSVKPAKAQIKVTLKKDAAATKYQIQYSLKKDFKGATIAKGKPVTKSTSKTTYTIKKLKKNTYYVRARAYTTDSKGKTVYGKWSTKKKVVVKK